MEIEESKEASHLLSDGLKWKIIFLKQQGLSDRETARNVANEYHRPTLSHKQVKYVWTKFQNTQGVTNNWSDQGRPRVTDDQLEEEIIEHCRSNRLLSANDIKEDLELEFTRQTVNNVLLRRGYGAYKAPMKLLFTEDNVESRLKFAQRHLRWNVSDWSSIIFSDESIFPFINSNGRIFVRRLQEEELNEDMVQPYSAFSKSIMVWGAISYAGVGPLVRVEGTLDSQSYLHIIRYRLKKYYPGLFDGNLTWQEDNAKPHKATEVRDWFEARGIQVLQWPAQSPDINIIEDVWNMLKYEMRGRTFEDGEDLWKELNRLWKKISVQQIQNLYDSLPRRMEALKDAEGYYTKY